MKGKTPKEGMVVSVKSGKQKGKRKGESVKEVLEELGNSREKKKKHRH